MIFPKNKSGQSSVEYAVLIILVIGAFIAIQNYMKRGIQGQWKAHVDELGDQYDPRTAVTDIRHTISSNTNTQILSVHEPENDRYYTSRTDFTESTEKKEGFTEAGGY